MDRSVGATSGVALHPEGRSARIYTQAPGTNPLALRACGLPRPIFDDAQAAPSAGHAAFYLVTAIFSGIEGSLGTDSSGAPRPNDHPCQ